jgi:hypothetical protein
MTYPTISIILLSTIIATHTLHLPHQASDITALKNIQTHCSPTPNQSILPSNRITPNRWAADPSTTKSEYLKICYSHNAHSCSSSSSSRSTTSIAPNQLASRSAPSPKCISSTPIATSNSSTNSCTPIYSATHPLLPTNRLSISANK